MEFALNWIARSFAFALKKMSNIHTKKHGQHSRILSDLKIWIRFSFSTKWLQTKANQHISDDGGGGGDGDSNGDGVYFIDPFSHPKITLSRCFHPFYIPTDRSKGPHYLHRYNHPAAIRSTIHRHLLLQHQHSTQWKFTFFVAVVCVRPWNTHKFQMNRFQWILSGQKKSHVSMYKRIYI